MAQQITLPIRPGQAICFPGLCVACGQPAGERLTIHKRQGQKTRTLDVPVCDDCARLSERRSGREESLLRAGWLAAGVGALLAFVLVWLITGSMPWWGRLMAGLIGAATAAGLAFWSFRRAAQAAELPEKRAVTEAARIAEFSWRDVTLALADAALAERVCELNGVAPAERDASIENE